MPRMLTALSGCCMPISCQVPFTAQAVSSTSAWARSNMRYSLLAAVLIGAAALGGCTEGVLDPKGPIAVAELQILLNSLGIMLAIVIPVILVGGVAWVGSHDLNPRKPIASTVKPLRVQVASLDWKWLFIYPDEGVASVNYLAIPVGTPVSFELTSSGVMNSFFVPQLGSQIYTMAGMVTRLHLQADQPGSYRGMSAQFSYRSVAPGLFNSILVSEMQSDDAMCRKYPTSLRAEK